MRDRLGLIYPALEANLGRLPIATLPTPVSTARLASLSDARDIVIKHDDVTGEKYGGNKVRKLQYLLHRARQRGVSRVVTFGAVGSNHAVATALYAIEAGFDCTCLLMHQSLKPGLGRALRIHQSIGTRIVAVSGRQSERDEIIEKHTSGPDVEVIPMGGTSPLGALGFVDAGLELAAQIEAGECPPCQRIYVAFGTMGTAVGIALGLALAGQEIETHAIRVTEETYASEAGARHLVNETAAMLHSLEPEIPGDLADRTRLVCRNEFFGDGYGVTNPETDRAIEIARDDADIALESTYTGKAMRALLADLESGFDAPVLFWNTYNSRPIDVDDQLEPDFSVMPEEFIRYF